MELDIRNERGFNCKYVTAYRNRQRAIPAGLAADGQPHRKMDNDVDRERDNDDATSTWNGASDYRQQSDAAQKAGAQEFKMY